MFSLILVLLILSIGAVSANDNISENEISISDSDFIGASFSDLQTIINEDTGGEINLTEDYTYSSSDGVISIDKQITINGNSHIIDANGASSIFNITGSNIILNNLTITNVNITTGKTNAILWNGDNGQLINCNISNNYVSQFLGAIVYWNATGGLIDECTFTNNDLSSNQASISYPVLWFGDDGVISNSTFINNSGTVNGGAVFWGGGADNGLIYNCTFINNTAWYGGAVYWNGANGTVSKSYFESNSAISYLSNQFQGGAIYWYSQDENGLITGCVFTNNTAASGEAIAIGSDTFLTLENSVFIGNDLNNSNTVNATTDTASAMANGNWWGNTIDNLIESPNTGGNVTVDNWLFLNVTANPTEIYVGKNSVITVDLTHIVDSEGSISQAEDYELHDSDLYVVDVVGGSVNETVISFTNGSADINYIAEEIGNGSLTVNLLGLDFTFDFVINISSLYVYADDIYIGQNATVYAVLPSDATGNVSIIINDNETFIIELTSGKGNRTISNLEIGNYTIFGYYEGDDVNPESNYTNTFNVLSKITVDIDANDTTTYESKGLSLDIILSEDITDNVTVIFDNSTYTVEIVEGTGVYTNSNISAGEYELNIYYAGDYKYESANATVNITVLESEGVTLTADNLTKYYKNSKKFVVNLTDSQGNPISNQSIQITINGVGYNRTTDDSGSASIAINLAAGTYETAVYYDGGDGTYDTADINRTITILTTVNGTDVTKVFRNATQYYATFRDSDGNYLADGAEVTFNINGVMYTRLVNGSEGKAKLNINLNSGTYIITAINPNTTQMSSNIITVTGKIVENSDLTKYYKNDSQYVVRLVNDDGTYAGAGEVVTFNINGVFYNRTTNESGYAKLNINLYSGDYIITAEYGGYKVSNNITVLPILYAEDIEMSYKDGTTFDAKLLDGKGNLLANETLQFNINGVLYDRVTNSSGVASLNINLMPGEYIITSSYNGYNIANTIKIN
ncbi:MAG: hypothetical protein IJQ68_00095 [Methanobrevibacter sp.]|uniref:beta strand repeat-containing protein n=1 Tax=Methanobrevibacter sp. TaxID=66852 RepID=UPI0025EB866D|nr:hypothetical protein [Methanobrevibacter sp.]MBR0270385.1 hypothetical protein [Methanobrevibacter sp.]